MPSPAGSYYTFPAFFVKPYSVSQPTSRHSQHPRAGEEQHGGDNEQHRAEQRYQNPDIPLMPVGETEPVKKTDTEREYLRYDKDQADHYHRYYV